MCGKSGKSENPEKTTERPQVTDKLYHIKSHGFEYTSSNSQLIETEYTNILQLIIMIVANGSTELRFSVYNE